jgi:hypothetical protein
VYLAADFQEKGSALRALRELKSLGFGTEDLSIFSDEPVELPRGVLDRPSHMSFVVVSGAIVFCGLAIAFVYFTQYNYPLITGGMPLFSFWATGVVFYELTMFGAIVTTFAWFLWESGLIRRRDPRVPVPAVQPEIICIRVHCRPEQVSETRRSLQHSGGDNLREMTEPA